MNAAAQPRLVNGSTTAVTICRARKTRVISARLRWRPVVRKRGQLVVCTRSVERMPRTTTHVSRISVTAPAPRVVYQRRLLDTTQREAPETATPVPADAALTPLEPWRLLDEPVEALLDALVSDDAVEVGFEEPVVDAADE